MTPSALTINQLITLIDKDEWDLPLVVADPDTDIEFILEDVVYMEADIANNLPPRLAMQVEYGWDGDSDYEPVLPTVSIARPSVVTGPVCNAATPKQRRVEIKAEAV